MTRSCIGVVFEKQIVLQTKRFMRVRTVKCLCSIFCVAFAWMMHLGGQMPGVGAPIIGVTQFIILCSAFNLAVASVFPLSNRARRLQRWKSL
jgi:hypothetical protein